MQVYSIGALLKIIIGISLLTILYTYVNVYQEPVLWLGFGFLSVFMVVRGISYFIFLLCYKLFSNAPKNIRSSASYKLSLLLGVYVMVNLTLMIIGKRTSLIGIGLLIIFCMIQVTVTNEQRKLY